ncbi:glycoside hydrolase/phage tail family protein [Asticcacaulis sp. EMRT-3]|uniref:baseplate multidomain protein megatron n=1 Tax=Asticcacaulis sp. EMRT-3 TaxID=3040349 RepID=UPI0024AF0B79|nr:glycoside hydrolase/phage tail family protein [Asticcacaulis sp. EMRT-3]MDI7775375.1 glycoside hydrolase/phage tail family protein [Asticcacaulis sp. EMRT-3]
MAQVILSAAGTALGGPIGGFIGHQIGAAIDRTVVNSLMPARQVGPRLTGLQLTQSAQGDPVAQVFGRMRVAGTVIWAARLKENRSTTRASKSSPKTESYSYSLSFAVALCEGPIDGIGRLWADGQLLDQSQIAYRLYPGTEDQTPDSLISAIEGSAPAYRGVAYLLFEDLDITPFGNRPPNLSVEVFRRPRGTFADMESQIEGVCLIPGAGEFIYATEPNALRSGLTRASFETQHTGDGRTDFTVALDQLQAQLPNVKRVNLVVSWFGTSLDAGACTIMPGVEGRTRVTEPLVWSVAGIARDTAHLVSQVEGRPAYGGTPSDDVVAAAITALKARGYQVTLIPFILMDCAGYPWRGRITSNHDMSAAAADDIAHIMGTAAAADFTVSAEAVTYSGPDEWGLRRFILHVAALGQRAGGVTAIVLGSELRGLTTVRSAVNTYPMVTALRDLAAQVRTLVGAGTQIGYGADWSEYFGHQPADGTGHAVFHLDPLWADDHIDFVGIDWYAPLTDWRDGTDHLDAQAGFASIYDPAYLQGRIHAGEDYDWYYASSADREAQVRTPIHDGAYGEDWMFRPKDIFGWWSNLHHDRPNGVRIATPTAWVAQSKPIRLIEIGCAAIDKGPNAPNLFLDPKSSESAIPPFSNGVRDDRAQRAYLSAFHSYYAANNPVSSVYGGPMLADMAVWCWDARPYPYFPQLSDVWGDTANWRTGHWLNGRVGMGDARNILIELAGQAGLGPDQLDLDEVTGAIDGYVVSQPMTAADALTPVLAWLGLEAAESGTVVRFVASDHASDLSLSLDQMAYQDHSPLKVRRDLVSVPASLSLRCYDPDHDYQLQSVTVRTDRAGADQMAVDLPLVLSAGQAETYAAYLLQAAQTVRHTLTLDGDPLMLLQIEAGDGVRLENDATAYRVTGLDLSETPTVTLQPAPVPRELTAQDPSLSGAVPPSVAMTLITGFILLELPCFGTDESDVRPILVPSADPWLGCDVYAGAGASSLKLRGSVMAQAGIGTALNSLPAQRRNYLLEQAFLDIYLEGEAPVSCDLDTLYAGGNFLCVQAASGEWEIVQYLNVTALDTDRYRLSGLVRGQWGSEQALASGIVAGASLISLPSGFVRADMSSEERGLSRLFRTGKRGFGAVAGGALDVSATWSGLALRPRAPVYGRITGQITGTGDLTVSWLRSPRYGGDSWEGEPPLCEEAEAYRVQVLDDAGLKRSVEVAASPFVYAAAMQGMDFPGGFSAGARIEIAQMSQIYGYGAVLSLAFL